MDGRGAWQPTRRELLRAAAAAGAGIAFPGPLARGALAARNADLDADAVTYRMWDARLDRELSPTEKLTALGHGANFAFGEVAAIAGELGETASIYDGAQVYLDRHGLGGDARRQAAFRDPDPVEAARELPLDQALAVPRREPRSLVRGWPRSVAGRRLRAPVLGDGGA